MKELIEKINATFLKRVTDTSVQKEIWVNLSEQFRPEISQYRSARPSTIIAQETGDIGLSVLWIVQTVLIRPILKDISLYADITEKISEILLSVGNNSICALANSESSSNPVVYQEDNGYVFLTGEKKFITAGVNADLIIITCRKTGEEKVSGFALVDRTNLPSESLTDLNLNIFRSVNHSKLTLKNYRAEKSIIPELDPAIIRRSLKKWGIIERALIMESFISFMIYVNRLFSSKEIIIARDDELIDFLNLQTDSANRQLEEALHGKKIETQNADTAGVFSILQKFKEKLNNFNGKFSEDEKTKLSDLSLFDSFKG